MLSRIQRNVELTPRSRRAEYRDVNLLTKPPSTIDQGTTVKWTSTFGDYSAANGWTAKIFAKGLAQFAGGAGIAGVANGSSFDFTLAPADTNLTPAGYKWQIRVYSGAEEYVAASGTWIVQPNFEAAGANGGTFNERMVAVLEAAIEKRLPADFEQIQIAGRAVVKIKALELHQLLSYYRNAVWLEQHPGKRRSMKIKFTGVSNECD